MTVRRDFANAIRALAMDAVQQANSGHPGAPMGMADIAEVLWRGMLKHNPGNPRWFNRPNASTRNPQPFSRIPRATMTNRTAASWRAAGGAIGAGGA